MIPESISFTEEEFVTRKLVAFRRRRGPYPASWVRMELSHAGKTDREIELWILDNIESRGRFGLEVTYSKATVYFERETDAVTFRLRDGETIFGQSEVF